VRGPRRGDNWGVREDLDGYLYGTFIVDGRRVQRGLGRRIQELERTPSGTRRTDKQVSAVVDELWEAKREELEQAQARKRPERRMIKDVMQEWMDGAEANGMSAETVTKHYALMANQYLGGVGNHPLGEIALAHVDKFKARLRERGLAPATTNMRLTRLKTFLRWAQARGYVTELPSIEKVKEGRRVPRVPLEEHIRAFWARLRHLATEHADPRQRYFYGLHLMMLLFVLGTGVRRAGPFHAKWEHVDFARAAVLLVKSKGGEERLDLPPLLVTFLQERRARYPHHVWLFDNGRGKLAYSNPHAISTAFRRHQAALGFAGLRIKPLHGFRALFATVNMNELGADSKTVAELLNHASFKTTENAYLAGMAKAKRRALVAYEEQYLAGLLEGGMPQIEAGGAAGAGS
jgi:integrase